MLYPLDSNVLIDVGTANPASGKIIGYGTVNATTEPVLIVLVQLDVPQFVEDRSFSISVVACHPDSVRLV